MLSVTISVERLSEGAVVPEYATDGAAGFDLSADFSRKDENFTVLQPGETKIIPTGLAVAVPAGFELQVRPRSGLAAKQSVTVLNSPGTVDSDYRGEVGVILHNHGSEAVTITQGMRMAQGVIAPVFAANFVVVEALDETSRGQGGFGSTGVSGSAIAACSQ